MKNATFREKPAFTMLELVFIIVIVGILAAVLIPRMGQSRLREAADQIVSHIRYTQHLAMIDDKYDTANATWFRGRWQMAFSQVNGEWTYSIFSDSDANGNVALTEAATNPLKTDKRLTGDSTLGNNFTSELNIQKKYGINTVIFNANCGAQTVISFDYIGRPMGGNPSNLVSAYPAGSLITQVCTITLTNNAGETLDITIQPESGYARVN